uniref:Apoptosis regulatory protein Siva n=1 Tax=Globisporangium ultimum (strain ATCC 200006 / CBS 805.95 / DAOM BR144) TaxID=431595 RepID=K3WRG1_GLOUD
MKRGREAETQSHAGTFSPVHPSSHAHFASPAFASISPWKPHPQAPNGFPRGKPVAMKRMRDRSVPIDAMSRMMSAAATNARMRKHSAQMQAMAMLPTSGAPCCSVCESGKRSEQAAPRQLSRCAYCEKLMGECCSRECEGCSNQFCSLCTTLNCDQQFDRVFCVSCNDAAQSSM